MKVIEIKHNNDDLTVVNAARTSFNKFKTKIDKSDEKLINYLVKNNHWTPLAHPRYRFSVRIDCWQQFAMWLTTDGAAGCTVLAPPDKPYEADYIELEHSLWGWMTSDFPFLSKQILETIKGKAPISFDSMCKYKSTPKIAEFTNNTTGKLKTIKSRTFLIDIPIFVARQLMRSNVGIVYNEVSRRYVDDMPEFWTCDQWRNRPDKSIKQGSGDIMNLKLESDIKAQFIEAEAKSLSTYDMALKSNAAPELSRTILPQSMMTKMWLTGTNNAIERILLLREGSHAQKEIRDLAKLMREAMV